MTNETIRIDTEMRLGTSICETHLCPCGNEVKNGGIHGLSCVHSAARISRYNMVNDITWRVMQRAKMSAAGNHQDYYEVTTSIHTVSCLYRGSKENAWHGT